MFKTMHMTTIENHMGILVNIIRAIQMKRVLSDLDPNPDLNFWRVMHGSFLDVAVLEWCKIFGVNSENAHWKLVIGDEEEQENFRTKMFESLGISSEQWDANWEHLKKYRNEVVAHHVAETDVGTYPRLDIALQSSYFYYTYLENLTGKKTSDTIEDYGDSFYKQSLQMACQAIASTRIFREKVY